MTIVKYTTLEKDYKSVVSKCKKSGQPIYLANHGKTELVAMDVSSFERREQTLKTQQLILESYAARLAGEKDYSVEESKKLIDELVK